MIAPAETTGGLHEGGRLLRFTYSVFAKKKSLGKTLHQGAFIADFKNSSQASQQF